MQTIQVTVTDKTKKYSASGSYTKYDTVDELIEVLETTEKDEEGKVGPSEEARRALAAANYGLNLRCRSLARQRAEAQAEGPEKALANAIKSLVALGFTVEEATATARAKLKAAPAPEPEPEDEDDEA